MADKNNEVYYVISMDVKEDQSSYMVYNSSRGYFIPNSDFNRAYKFKSRDKACEVRDSLSNIESTMRKDDPNDVEFMVKEYTLSETDAF